MMITATSSITGGTFQFSGAVAKSAGTVAPAADPAPMPAPTAGDLAAASFAGAADALKAFRTDVSAARTAVLAAQEHANPRGLGTAVLKINRIGDALTATLSSALGGRAFRGAVDPNATAADNVLNVFGAALARRYQSDASLSIAAAPADTASAPVAETSAPAPVTQTPASTPKPLPGPGPTPAGLPPGRAGTTPGQSASPPPGQAGTTPGQAGTTPGQIGTTPGQAGTTPKQTVTTSGQSTTAPPKHSHSQRGKEGGTSTSPEARPSANVAAHAAAAAAYTKGAHGKGRH